MRVLVVTVVHHPADARILHRQIRSLLDAGHQVTYVAPWAVTGSVPPGEVDAVDVPRAHGRARVGAVLSARRRIRELSPGADIVLVHDPELLLAAVGAARAPVVWDVHEDTASALGDKSWLPSVLRAPVRAAVRGVERGAERRVRLLLAEERYAHRFAGAHPFMPNETVVPEQVEPSGQDRVVYVGRLSWGRGADELMAVADALPAGVTMELMGPADADVEPALRAAHEAGRLVWRGFVPNDAAVARLEGALAGLSLLRDEPNYRHSRPTKVVEYMARGVPVITTQNPFAAETVERNRCGIVVPFQDPAAAVAGIGYLSEHPDERRAMGRRGHAAAAAHYDWRETGRRFVAQLEQWAVAAGTPSSASEDESVPIGRVARGQAGSASVEHPDYWWYRLRSRLLETVFSPTIPPEALVLDVGSADGPSVGWLRGIRLCVPIDIDPRGLQPGGVCADALQLPFADGTFDVVAAFDVIEHFADEAGVMAELIRVLRPLGTLAISVPAYQWAWSSFDVAAGHHRRYTRSRLLHAAEKASLEVRRLTHACASVLPFFAVVRLADRIHPPSRSTTLPSLPRVIERGLLQLGRIDSVLLRRMNLPFGSSIFLVGRKRS